MVFPSLALTLPWNTHLSRPQEDDRMNYEKDKDLGWLITFASFLVFLLAAITSAVLDATPPAVPEAVFLANATLGRAFASVACSFVRYVAIAGMIYGAVAIVTWPPGPN